MLEKYFTKMSTVDRYQSSWMGAGIESYVVWLAGHDYKDRCIWSRVPLVFAFGEFASSRGATETTTPAATGRADTDEPSSVVRTLTAQLAELKRRHRDEVHHLRGALEVAHGENLQLRRRLGHHSAEE